jgi:flagellar biosynthesis/type III secretory pathway chaperone
MDIEKSYQNLVSNLEELTKIYRHLLDVVRKEKDLLIQVDLKALEESNKSKEAFLNKLRILETNREKCARELAQIVGTDTQSPRLLDIAKKLKGPNSDKLRSIHETLDLLLSHVTEQNRENAIYVDSALQKLGGALNEVKETVSGKKTYERQGKMTTGPDKSGNFVSKEA